MSADPVVSVLVPVLNEAESLERVVDAMKGQRLTGAMELLFIDGGSTDGTRELLAELAGENGSVRLLDNPARRIPHALNLGLREARGAFIARMDAHSVYPPDYLAVGIDRLRRDDVEWASGPQIAQGVNAWSRAVALALSLPLGVGGAQFRYALEHEIEVDTGFTGVWRRSTLEELGGWNEDWLVNEDAELAARVRARGGRIICMPEMAARYTPRRTPGGLARQYWSYGRFRAKTSREHPESMRRSHLLPPALVLASAAAALGPPRGRGVARQAVVAYGACLLGESLRQLCRGHRSEAGRLPAVLATMHTVWGAGFLVGCARYGPPVRALGMTAIAKRRESAPT